MSASYTEDEIQHLTGFASGDRWESEAEVRSYFTVEVMKQMFGPECELSQDELDKMADLVVKNRWWMA